MKPENPVTAAAAQLSASGILVTVLYFLQFGHRSLTLWYPLLWMAGSVALYAADRLFLRRERTVQSAAILNIILGAALFAGSLVLDGWRGPGTALVAGVGCVVLCAQGVQLTLKPIKLSTAVQWLDVSLVLLVLFTAYVGALGASLLWALPLTLGCLAAVAGLVCFRAGGSLSPAGWGFLGATLLVLGGIVWLLFRCAAAGVGRGLLALWNALTRLGALIGSAVNRFMAFLASLFPEESLEGLEGVGDAAAAVEGDESAVIQTAIPSWVYLILVLAVVVIVVLLLWYLRRLRTGGTRQTLSRSRSVRRSRPSLWSALRERIAYVLEGMRLRRYLSRHRDTALGCFYTLTRLARRQDWRRGLPQSPRVFLTDLSARADGDPDLEAALTNMIPLVEQALFAPEGKDIPCPDAPRIRRAGRTLFPKTPRSHSRGRRTNVQPSTP